MTKKNWDDEASAMYERRHDSYRSNTVDVVVVCQQLLGDRVAREHLIAAGVGQEIIERVLNGTIRKELFGCSSD